MKKKVSLLRNAIFYLILGFLFVFIAVQTAGDTIWNFTTILLALIATFDIGIGVRLLIMHFKLKKK
jgi:hypothetical protein